MELFAGIAVFFSGFIAAKWPYFTWYWSVGWQFSEAEPSELALKVHKFSGYFLMFFGAGLCLEAFY